jgi:hypothetical protein
MKTTMTVLAGAFALATGCTLDTSSSPADPPASPSPAEPSDFVQTPAGLVHKTCVHQLADGDTVDDQGNILRANGELEVLAPCAYVDPLQERKRLGGVTQAVQPATDNGWTETAYWHAPTDVGDFFSTGRVPYPPATQSSQLIYLFSALEDETEENIIQPVLQWGYNGAFGGKYWGIASWYGGSYWSGHYYASAYKAVKTGDFVAGAMEGQPPPDSCAGGCNWVTSTWTSTQQTVIEVHTPLAWRYVFGGTIEVYGVNSCSEYPTYDYFENFEIYQWDSNTRWTPSWAHAIWKTTCGEHITSNSSIVNLYY